MALALAVAGYPRIGKRRELKVATEGFFKGEVSAAELAEAGRALRAQHWRIQKDKGIAFIASNDFSFYDQMLDTAVMLGVIPERFEQLSGLEQYFAMARGYQRGGIDVKPLAMKKWFNTNYHYLVPEIGPDQTFRLRADKGIEEFREARALGIETVPVVIGPLTFLALSHFSGEGGKVPLEQFAEPVAAVYGEMLERLASEKAAWVRVDEPVLVKDLSGEEKDFFKAVWTRILGKKKQAKVLLQTYFGDVRECYREMTGLPFDGIGLDFVEGSNNIGLIARHGIPGGMTLFAGVVNGKNIWRNDYENTLKLIEALQAQTGQERLVLSTSCSLLHVPYSVTQETGLGREFTDCFAFAEEKLDELGELRALASLARYEADERFQRNKAVRVAKAAHPLSRNRNVRERVAGLTEGDFVRTPALPDRRKVQARVLPLPLLPTTTIGSFPQTAEVRQKRKEFHAGKLTDEAYASFLQDKIRECVNEQEKMGLDVLVHGEFERNDMVEYFGENLAGFVFTRHAWVQSYGTRCVKPPVIFGDVYRERPFTVDWITFAQQQTDKPVKGMLTGPVTILNWSFVREDVPLKEIAFQIGLAIRDEVLDLEKAGMRMIQIDEAALREKLPLRREDWQKEYLDWAVKAFRLTHTGVQAQTQIHTHMCYSEFGDIADAIAALDADVISFEASRSALGLLATLAKWNGASQVGPGVYDIHSPRVPGKEEMAETLRRIVTHIDPKRVWVNPDCGLKTRQPAETAASLRNLVAAAKEVRSEL